MKVWLIGAYGIVSTTAMVGGKALEEGLIERVGLVSELPFFEGIEKYAPLNFEFGGHEIRPMKNAYVAALDHWEQNRHFERDILENVKNHLENIAAKKGTALNCGSGIEELGKIENIKIIGIPQKGDKKKIISNIKDIVATRKF